MTAPRQRGPACLDPETLAAFLDGRLDANLRAQAEVHLAECEDCYEALVETTKTIRAIETADTRRTAEPAAVPTGRRMKWWYAGGLAAAAAVVLAISVVPGLVRQNRVNRAMQDLVVAVGTNRFTEARLSDDFSWGPRPATLRSGLQSSLPASLLVATSRIQMLTEGQDDGWMLRARGISALAAGDVSTAIQALEQAVTADPQEARLRNDLAAALLERYRLRGDVADANAALARVTEALRMEAQLAPALFNRALALEAISGASASRQAWMDYLAVDSTSQWAAEARAHVK